MRVPYDPYMNLMERKVPWYYGYTMHDSLTMFVYYHIIPLNYLIHFWGRFVELQIRILRRIL